MSQPPVIITTQDDSTPPSRPSPPRLIVPGTGELGPPITPPRSGTQTSDPHRLSPSNASPPSGAGLTPPSPTLTATSSVHFSDDLPTPTTPAHTALALRDNHPSADNGMDTLKVVQEGDERPTRHGRGWSVGTWASEETAAVTAKDSPLGEKGDLTPATSRKSWIPWGKDKDRDEIVDENDKKKKKEKTEEMAHLDPDKDTTDPTPFKENPSRLAMLVDPKSLEDLTKIGGITGLLEGLGVDGTKGLAAGANEGQGHSGAPRSSADVERRNGAQWSADLETRRKIYGRNDLPIRPSKSLLQLMWMAFKDGVIVSPTCLAQHLLMPDFAYCRRYRISRPRSIPRPRCRP